MQTFYVDEQVCLFDPYSWSGKTSPEPSPVGSQKARTSASSSRRSSVSSTVPYMRLDLTPGHGDLLGNPYWEMIYPLPGGPSTPNTGVCPRDVIESSLSQILEDNVPPGYYLTRRACLGILRRAKERGKPLPRQLELARMIQAGLIPLSAANILAGNSYHINQRNEGIDLDGLSGALMRTQNMQMQTFVTQPEARPIAFAANQRDEVRDLHDVAGALGAQPGMKQQTFIAENVGNCLNPWDTQQSRIFTPDSVAPTVAGADGGGGRNPAGLLFSAAFNAGAGPGAGGIGYAEEASPTLKASESGTNMVPSVLCLNDQGGSVMDCSEDVSGTLRAQEHGHQPLVFENHGIDSRYTGPHDVVPTISASYGTGGNNVPLVTQEEPIFCITGNIIDRKPENGGNGIGCQEDIAYTLTATDYHAVFSRQRVDLFTEDDVASTESARQHKDATDLVYQETVGALTSSDRKGPNSQYVAQDKCVLEGPHLIRRLTPLECERLQGFPDGWTNIPGASDSARYKALGNSVAIPCVKFVMCRIAAAIALQCA